MDQIAPEAGAFYVMDRGYLDFERLYRLTLAAAFFVTRTKENVLLQRRYSHPVDRTSDVKSDHTVMLAASGSLKHYPAALRRVRYFDTEHQRFLVFLTNNFELPAQTIANLYKSRWQVELFFKWIKQHLRIKVFLGTSQNAVRTQIWTAISIYVLVAIIRKELNLSESLPNPTGCQRHHFRASAHSTGPSATTYRRKIRPIFQPTESVRLIAGHYCVRI